MYFDDKDVEIKPLKRSELIDTLGEEAPLGYIVLSKDKQIGIAWTEEALASMSDHEDNLKMVKGIFRSHAERDLDTAIEMYREVKKGHVN